MINFITTKHCNEVFYLKNDQHGLKEVVKICSRGIQFVIESKQQRNIDITSCSRPFTMRQICNDNLPLYIKLNKHRTNILRQVPSSQAYITNSSSSIQPKTTGG